MDVTTLPAHRSARPPRRVGGRRGPRWAAALLAALVTVTGAVTAAGSATAAPVEGSMMAAAACPDPANPTQSSGTAAVRTMIGVAKSMGVPYRGQVIAVMVMLQESSIRNLANDGTSPYRSSYPWPGRAYYQAVAKQSLYFPHDRFGSRDGAYNADSIGLFQQRPAYGWGNYGASNGRTDPIGVVRRLLDPRWESMAFFGGSRSAAPNNGLLDVPNWQNMDLAAAAEAVQQSGQPQYYGQWQNLAVQYVNNNSGVPAIDLPWYPGGGPTSASCGEPLTLSLRAKANNQLVTAEAAGSKPLIANRPTVGSWEQFQMYDLGNGRVALRSVVNGFTSADGAGSQPLIANRPTASDWEQFLFIPNADGTISLRSTTNGRYVTAEAGGSQPLIANRTSIGLWEQFELIGR